MGFCLGPIEESDNTNGFLFFLQERTRSFDGFSMHSLENSLIDIMRAEQDSLKGLFPPKPFHSNIFLTIFYLEEYSFPLFKRRELENVCFCIMIIYDLSSRAFGKVV